MDGDIHFIFICDTYTLSTLYGDNLGKIARHIRIVSP